ncbi:hypothetical protein [Sinomicrobium pectinilyticum]|uniref:hypothetical protein n=1 Tax=Sinomicrobium pectinilyticum TaxID=1084421 RepID=UPI0029390BFD|nr:hypothetical protein [Sinomicrobium pectinilyticum]
MRNPKNIRLGETTSLEQVIEQYPFFQCARALHLKGLKNLNSFKYNDTLKKTAAYTTDRAVLFDLITSRDFIQNRIARTIAGNHPDIAGIEVNAQEIRLENRKLIEQTHIGSEKEAEQILDPSVFMPVEKELPSEEEQQLHIGEPLEFSRNEKHSFTEWLKLSAARPVQREEKKSASGPGEKETASDQSRKFKLIDKFIKANPKIVPKAADRNKETPVVNLAKSTQMEKAELMTETLAKVYLEQKRYKNAIQAYKILSLKYPEKSGFFADQIRAIRKLQQSN